MAHVTPLRRQYLEIKREYPDCILLFRLGDFYEMFDSDAEIAARELDLTLTGRPVSKEERVPMAGVPHHAIDTYIARLIEKGYHVAVCEQMSEPDGRGVVERAVTRVITPGTVIEANLLTETRANYLMAILPVGDPAARTWTSAGVAYADASTGEFAVTTLSGDDVGVRVLEEIARIEPTEVLLPAAWVEAGVTLPEGIHKTPIADWRFELAQATEVLTTHFRVRTLDGFGIGDQPAAIRAAGAVLHYLSTTQRGALAQITGVRAYATSDFMVLDPFTRRNLELTESIRQRGARGSLLGVLDRTLTPMGARLLRTWIAQPLLDVERIRARLDAVEALTGEELLRADLGTALRGVSDLERLTNRLLIGKASPRDLMALAETLSAVPLVRDRIAAIPALAPLTDRLDPCAEADYHIRRALVDDPPAALTGIGVIRPGYSGELDGVMDATRHAREWIAALEPQERARTGIGSLKVGFNRVFGYYIEVSKAQSNNVPSDYQRKQTLVNAERYITPELKEYEALVLNAEEQIMTLEKALFDALCTDLGAYRDRLLRTARALAHVDAFLSLATVAVREGYSRPTLTTDDLLIIRDGRHPVVETLLPKGTRYVPNDTHFDTMSRIHIITGPNMSGKSTYIRQVAIIALMAQIGSFVPADEATIGVVDRIFARIGAQDEIHAGYSTFMVEMVETARLLNGSSPRSLLILDEVGRGTSTYDGIAIARAVIEYIHNTSRLNCRTLFATHYHELTELPNILPRSRNYNVTATEDGESIVFLHKVMPGGADRSYGVHVARLAGLPKPVIDRANALLNALEAKGDAFEPPTKRKQRENPAQLQMFDEAPHPILTAIKGMRVEELSGIEALTRLYEFKRMLDAE